MIRSKYTAVITAAAVILSLVACGFIVYAANTFETVRVTEYETKMFSGGIAEIDIQVDESEWLNMLDNAQAKEWISADVIIDGTRFGTVGVRTKGNSSLTAGNRGGSSGGSYSLSFKSNKYVKGQTFFGLDSFCVNNMIGDATYMKDYIAYDIMKYIGVDTPLVNYARVSVNGEAYGFGIMLERYDEAFLDRVYGNTGGELYSVKIGMGQRGDFEGMWQDAENEIPQRRQREAAGFGGENANGGGFTFGGNFPGGEGREANTERRQGGGFGGGMGGGSLVYTGDDPDSYSSIFSNSVKNPDKISDGDKRRVITALENLNAGTDLEKYIDVDAALRYFAAHTVMVNGDSYTSNMAQNYYLYERGGKLTILPWDYNLSFGGMGGMGGTTGASGVVNFPIDTPVSGVSMEERPLLNKLLEVPEYMDRYHEYLRQIAEGYLGSGLYEERINELDAKINGYVKGDVSANYTYEQYEESLTQLSELLRLRGESIMGQLDGKIPSSSSGQSAGSTALIDASGVNLSALGSMGGGQGGGQGNRGELAGGMDGGFGMENGIPGGEMSGGAGRDRTAEGQDALPDGFGGARGAPPNGNGFGNMPGNGSGNTAGGTAVPGVNTASNAIILAVPIVLLISAAFFIAKRHKNTVV